MTPDEIESEEEAVELVATDATPPVEVEEEEAEPAVKTKSCPVCGETIKFSAKKCIHCDEYLEEEEVTGFWRWFGWTGLKGKTAWDGMRLLIIPLLLFGAGIYFSNQQDTRQFDIEANRVVAQSTIEADRLQENALQAYFDQMTELLIKEELRTSDPEADVRIIARSRTLATVRGLDPDRKGALLIFLYEAQLIDIDTIVIDLNDADLRGAYLRLDNLSGADLHDTDLRGADLHEALLLGNDLSGANLSEADLRGVLLVQANLSGADLSGADLSKAFLFGADLSGADLSGADLSEVFLSEFFPSEGNPSENTTTWTEATYNDRTQWPDDFKPTEHGMILVDE